MNVVVQVILLQWSMILTGYFHDGSFNGEYSLMFWLSY